MNRLPGLAVAVSIALLACAPAALAKGPTKRKATLFVHQTGCEVEMEAKAAKLEKAKQDSLGLRVKNDCGIQRKAIACVYDAKGQRATPFGACTSVPPGIGVGSPFTLAANGGSAEIDCPAQAEGSYFAMMLIGDGVRSSGCPASPPKERVSGAGEETFNHRLPIEIVP
jgi:hypothetical protein